MCLSRGGRARAQRRLSLARSAPPRPTPPSSLPPSACPSGPQPGGRGCGCECGRGASVGWGAGRASKVSGTGRCGHPLASRTTTSSAPTGPRGSAGRPGASASAPAPPTPPSALGRFPRAGPVRSDGEGGPAGSARERSGLGKSGPGKAKRPAPWALSESTGDGWRASWAALCGGGIAAGGREARSGSGLTKER